ncbi:hypothetical protein QJQ45_025508, partial [Haematococcus lacustris]
MGGISKRTKAIRANGAQGRACAAVTRQQQILMSTAAATEAALDAARSQLCSSQTDYMRTATELQVCQEQLHQSQQALQQSENEVFALQASLHRCQAELATTKQELTACQSKVRSMGTQLAAMRAQLATAKRAMPKDVQDKMSWLQRNEVSLYTLKRWHAMWGAPPCTQAASPATALKVPPPPCHKERATVTGAFTAAYACSNAALLTLPNVSCQQLGPLRTAVAAAEFPDAPPQPQAGPSTVRRHQLMLTCDIQRTFEGEYHGMLPCGLLRQAPAIHIQMDGCTITSGKVVLYCASAAIPATGPRLPTLAADPPTPAQILAHGQEPNRILCRVLAIRKCLDSTAAAQAQDLEQLLTEANLWGLLASVTVDSAASNVGRTGGQSPVNVVVGHNNVYKGTAVGRAIRHLPFRGVTSTAPAFSKRRVDPSLQAVPLQAVTGLHGQTSIKTTLQGHIARTSGKGQPTLEHTSDDPQLTADEVSAWLHQCHAPALDGVQYEWTKQYAHRGYQCLPVTYTFSVPTSQVTAMLSAHEQTPYITDVATHTAVTSGRLRCSLEEAGLNTYPHSTTAIIQLASSQVGEELGLSLRNLNNAAAILPTMRHAMHLAVDVVVHAVAGPPPTEPAEVPSYAATITASPLWRIMKALDAGAITMDPQHRQNCYVVHSETDHLQQLLDRYHRISISLGNTFVLTLTSTNPPQPPPYCIAISSPSSISAAEERPGDKYEDLLNILVQLQVSHIPIHPHRHAQDCNVQMLDNTLRNVNANAATLAMICHSLTRYDTDTSSPPPTQRCASIIPLYSNPRARYITNSKPTNPDQPMMYYIHMMPQAEHNDPRPILELLAGVTPEHEQWRSRISTEPTRPLTFTNLQGDLLTLEVVGSTLTALVVTRRNPLTQQVTRDRLEADAMQCAAMAFCAADGTPLYSCSKGQVSKEMLIQVGSNSDLVNLLAAAHGLGDDLKVRGEVIRVGLPRRYLTRTPAPGQGTQAGTQVVWVNQLANKGLDSQSGREVSSEEAAVANASRTSLGSITSQDGFVFRAMASIAAGCTMAEVLGANATRTMQGKATTAMASARVDPVGPSSYAPQIRRANTHLGPTPTQAVAAPRRGWATHSQQDATRTSLLPPRAEGARPTPHDPPPPGRPTTGPQAPPMGRPLPHRQPASRGPSPSGGRHSRNPSSRGSSGSSVGAFDDLAIEAGYLNMNRAPSDAAVDASAPAAPGGGAPAAASEEAAAAATAAVVHGADMAGETMYHTLLDTTSHSHNTVHPHYDLFPHCTRSGGGLNLSFRLNNEAYEEQPQEETTMEEEHTELPQDRDME